MAQKKQKKESKNLKVRDLKPRKDAKGGGGKTGGYTGGFTGGHTGGHL